MCTLHTTMLCEPTIRLCFCTCFLLMLWMRHQRLPELSWRSLHCYKIQALATFMQRQCKVLQKGATTIKCGQASHFPSFSPIFPHFPSFFPLIPFFRGLVDTGILRIWILPRPEFVPRGSFAVYSNVICASGNQEWSSSTGVARKP